MRIQSIFRKTHKLLFSVVAILLIISMIPTQVFAEESSELTVGVTWGNATGHSGMAYGKGGSNWSDMTRDQNGEAKINHAFVGYRVYVVDSAGNLKSSVVDLKYQDEPTGSIAGSTIKVGNITVTTEELYITKTTNYNAVASTGSTGRLQVYISAYYNDKGSLGGGTYTLGSNFATWMQVKDSSGEKNAKKLMRYALGDDNVETYLAKDDYRLIVEPLMYSDVWTPYEWVTVEKAYVNEYCSDHFIKIYNGVAYDMCCDKGKSDGGNGITRDEYRAWCINTHHFYAMSLLLKYDKPDFDSATSVALNGVYFLEQLTRLSNEKQVISDLGYGDVAYTSLTEEQQLAVYNKMVEKGYSLVYGRAYIKNRTQDGYVYTNSNKISYYFNGIETTLYADWNIAYASDPTHWSNTNEQHTKYGKHYVAAYTGDVIYGTYTNVKTYLASLNNLNGTKCNDWSALGGVCKDYQNPLGDGFCLSKNESFGSTSYGAGTKGMHIYHMTDIDSEKPIHTYDIDTNPTVPDESEQPSEPKQNTGTSNIIKVYGKVYRYDTGKYHYMEDYKTAYVTTNTTDEIIITDEYEKTGYTLTQWVVSSKKNTGVTATKWAKINSSSYGLDYSTLKSTLGVTAYTMTSTGSGLVHGEDNPLTIGEGNTLYLLYLKTLPAIETSDTKVPDTTTDFEPTNPTYPEVPTGDKKKDPNGYNIIKVYTILDEYNGTPLKSETYTQSSTTPFIKIEQESNWTLAHWKVTNTYNPSITAGDSKDI